MEEEVTVYNFEVADFHTYYVADCNVLVHNRNCSNPYGKKGGPAHQNKINALDDFYSSRGYNVSREVPVNTSGGFKSKRFADLMVNGKGENFYVQVGKATKGGLPVAREIRALKDLIGVGKKVIFFAYNT